MTFYVLTKFSERGSLLWKLAFWNLKAAPQQPSSLDIHNNIKPFVYLCSLEVSWEPSKNPLLTMAFPWPGAKAYSPCFRASDELVLGSPLGLMAFPIGQTLLLTEKTTLFSQMLNLILNSITLFLSHYFSLMQHPEFCTLLIRRRSALW